MANTTSLAFPKMFDISQNKVSVLTDSISIVSRTRLLMLTDPTALYNEPEQGVGLRRYIGRYNTENVKAEIKDRIIEQLREHEPCVVPDKTDWADGLIFTGQPNDVQLKPHKLEMTVALKTIYDSTASVDITLEEN
jgi:phage baseplate assembly protein W